MDFPHRSIESYVHKHRIGVLVEFGMSSYSTSQVPEIKSFMSNIALHIAACAPENLDELLRQYYIKEPDNLIRSYINDIQTFVSEEIAIIRFERWDVSEDNVDPTDPPRSPANVIRFKQAR